MPLPRPAPATRGPPAPPPLRLLVRETPAVYRPRRPERTDLYRLFERHFDRYLRAYEERFEPREGPLRPVVPQAVEAYLACGRLLGGFARIRCPECRGEHLLAFSCQTRNFCPSCQAKRAALFAEQLEERILAPVPHRHLVFTVPRALRGLFQRDRRLLSLLSRCAYRALRLLYQAHFGRKDALPGCVASLQTFGARLPFHPHVHALVTEGLLTRPGAFLPLAAPDLAAVAELFRHLLLESLVRARRLSEGFRERLLSWRRSGFSVWGEQVVLPGEGERLLRLARYLTRPPLASGRVREAAEGSFLLEAPPDPSTGATLLAFDPLDLIHALVRQIPDPRQHLVRYYGAYANRARRLYRLRGDPREADAGGPRGPALPDDAEGDDAKARRRSWARLLRKILEVEPLLCPRCRVEMRIVSVITDPMVVDAIVRHLEKGKGKDPHAPRAPPAA